MRQLNRREKTAAIVFVPDFAEGNIAFNGPKFNKGGKEKACIRSKKCREPQLLSMYGQKQFGAPQRAGVKPARICLQLLRSYREPVLGVLCVILTHECYPLEITGKTIMWDEPWSRQPLHNDPTCVNGSGRAYPS